MRDLLRNHDSAWYPAIAFKPKSYSKLCKNNDIKKCFSNRSGLTNGNGLSICQGLTNGNGLTDGNGLTNGNGLTININNDRHDKSNKLSNIQYKQIRARIFSIIIVLVFLSLPLAIYSMDFKTTSENRIYIDGNFSDWNSVVLYHDSFLDMESKPNINIDEFGVRTTEERFYCYLSVADHLFAGTEVDGKLYLDSIRVLIDIDQDHETGYCHRSIGVDYMLELHGSNGILKRSAVYMYSSDTNANWNCWKYYNNCQVSYDKTTLELVCDFPLEIGINRNSPISVYFHTTDGFYSNDQSDYVIDNCESGAFLINEVPLAGDIIENYNDKIGPNLNINQDHKKILELEISAKGQYIELTDGSLEAKLLSVLPDYIEPPTLPDVLLAEQRYNIPLSLNVNADKMLSEGELIEICLLDNHEIISNGLQIPTTIDGNPLKGYYKAPPKNIQIDGAFGDWLGFDKVVDFDFDGPINRNQNVNISEYCTVLQDDALSFYLRVDGTMMVGATILSEPLLLFDRSTNTESDSPLNSQVQNRFDLVNEGTRQALTGYDVAYIMMDLDNNIMTGYSKNIPIGAEYMIKLLGKEGQISNREMYSYDQGVPNGFKTDINNKVTSQPNWYKLEESNILAATDTHRLEAQISIQDMPLFKNSNELDFKDNIQIHYLMTDWTGNKDHTTIDESINLEKDQAICSTWYNSWLAEQTLNESTYQSLPVSTRGWSIKTVQSTGTIGEYTSIALDSSGYPHISYYDKTNGDLKYSTWTGASWNRTTVDSQFDVGEYTSIALDSNNYPHISYYDRTNGDLKYAAWTGTTWNVTTVQSTDDVGRYTSIAIDSYNYPHISYNDFTNGNLRYTNWTGVKWCNTTIDKQGNVGYYTSLALDSCNYPHISYFDSINGDLKYAKMTSLTWKNFTIDKTGIVGEYSSLALDSNDYPHISYLDRSNGYLKYSRWAGTSWSKSTVDSSGSVGYFTSIVIDSNDYPHISYLDATNMDLKYAKRMGIAWNITTVHTTGKVGYYSSIVLNQNDRPYISYYDSTNSDLMCADNTIPEYPIGILPIIVFCILEGLVYSRRKVYHKSCSGGNDE